MSHEIEHFEDGSDAFVGARTPAWHKLGTILPSGVTAEQAMDLARLGDWQIEKSPVQAVFTRITGSGEHREVTEMLPTQYALTRINPVTGRREPLGGKWQRCVGERYEIMPNEHLTDFLQALVDESGAFIETAGSIHGGADVFVTAKLPDTMQVGGRDAVDQYVVVTNNHNGSSAVTGAVTPVRVVCANTLAAALRGARSAYHVRHTLGAKANVAEARRVLGLSFRYLEDFQAEADRMIDQEYTDREFKELVSGLWAPVGDTATPRSKTMEDNRNRTLRWLFSAADTNDGIHGTRWGAYQAVTEYLDHYSPVKGRGLDSEAARAARTVSGTADTVKRDAFARLVTA